MANTVRELARRLWNGNGKRSSLDATPVPSPEQGAPVDPGGETETERPSVLVLDKNSVLAEIWDNDEDAIYDEPGAAQAGAEDKAPISQTEEIWLDGEVYREIWDNDEDAIYDDLPGVRAILG